MGDEVGFCANNTIDSESLLAFADYEESVIDEALVLNDFPDAANFGGAGGQIGIQNAEAEVGLEKSVHHNAVVEFEDLQGESRSGKKNKRKREKR